MDALSILAARLEDSDEVQQRAKEVTILTVNELPPGTIVLGQARRCATPDCPHPICSHASPPKVPQ